MLKQVMLKQVMLKQVMLKHVLLKQISVNLADFVLGMSISILKFCKIRIRYTHIL
jgi:hypothetical protein